MSATDTLTAALADIKTTTSTFASDLLLTTTALTKINAGLQTLAADADALATKAKSYTPPEPSNEDTAIESIATDAASLAASLKGHVADFTAALTLATEATNTAAAIDVGIKNALNLPSAPDSSDSATVS